MITGRTKSVYYVLLSHALEKCDLYLYSFFFPIISQLYFPKNTALAFVGAIGTFIIGYIIRPFGALYFGLIGDLFSRKIAFAQAIVITIIPTTLIGFIPTYESIGIMAPILLIFCRLLQGFSAGGEFTGAALIIMEQNDTAKHAVLSSLVRSVGFFGVALGTVISAICTLNYMPSWSWRLPFIISGFLTILAFIFRDKIYERPHYVKLDSKNKLEIPLLRVFKHYFKEIMFSIGISIWCYFNVYFTTIYLCSKYVKSFGYSIHESMLINILALTLCGIFSFLGGLLSYKKQLFKYLIKTSIITTVVTYLSCAYFLHLSEMSILILLILLSITTGIIAGPITAIFMKLFPYNVRYSAVSFILSISQVIAALVISIYSNHFIYTNISMFPIHLFLLFGIFAILFLWKLNTMSGQRLDIKDFIAYRKALSFARNIISRLYVILVTHTMFMIFKVYSSGISYFKYRYTIVLPNIIVFDWDNTLAYTWPYLLNAMNSTITQFNKEKLTLKQLMSYGSIPQKEVIKKIFGSYRDDIEKVYWQYLNKEIKNIALVDGTINLLKFCKAHHIKMCILSSQKGDFIRSVLKNLDVEQYFSNVIGIGDSIYSKPKISATQIALKPLKIELGLKEIDHIWYVGDSEVDLLTATNAKITPVIIKKHSILNLNKYCGGEKHVYTLKSITRMLEVFKHNIYKPIHSTHIKV